MNTKIFACAAAAMLASAMPALGQVKLVEDQPLRPAPKSGDVSGTISPAQDIVEVYARNRDGLKTFPGKFDKATGEFTVQNLPGDAVYDVGVKLGDGRVIEGIDLSPLDARFLRLAELRRKQLHIPPEEQHVFDQGDANSLLTFAKDLKSNDFMDQGRVLYLAGHGRRATMVVELMRTREFYDQKHGADGAQLIWRVEIWYYEFFHGGWERVPNQERVLRRERLASGKWSKISVEYLPQLSVFLDSSGKSEPVTFKIPDKPAPSTGRPAGTDPKLETKPHISGMQATAESQPEEKEEQ